MQDNNFHNKTLRELASGLRNKEFSSEELTRSYLQRIERLDTKTNAFITVTEETALQQARAADQLLSQNQEQAGPLTGIPIVHKDIFCTTGIKTSCGSKMLDNIIAPYDATVVEKCAAAGLVMLVNQTYG